MKEAVTSALSQQLETLMKEQRQVPVLSPDVKGQCHFEESIGDADPQASGINVSSPTICPLARQNDGNLILKLPCDW